MGTGIEDVEQTCLICGRRCCNRRSLGNHIARSHKDLGGPREYVVRYMLDGVIPQCNCGCGKEVSWQKTGYRFNDYVNGHNPAGYTKVGYTATPEQIAYRNEKIREAYTNRRDEISTKIGNSLRVAFQEPHKNANLRRGQQRGWQNNSERKRKLALRNIDMLATGLIGPRAPFKAEWKFNPFTGRDERMHSSWETMFLDEAVRQNVHVTKEHELVIPYIAPDGSQHVYIPDFFACESNTIIELKGRSDEIEDAKRSAAEMWCLHHKMKYCVIYDVSHIPSLISSLIPPYVPPPTSHE